MIPEVTAEQKEILDTQVSELSSDQLFTGVPLAARLTKGLDDLSQLATTQIAEITRQAVNATGKHPPEARIRKIDN